MTSTQRAATFKARKRAEGLEQCNVWVPAELVAEMQQLAAALCANRDLTVGPARNTRTGKWVSTS